MEKRKNNIRWSKNDHKRVANAVRSFNAKITRTLKKHPEWEGFLPSKIDVKTFKEKIETRQDLNRELNSVLRFMKKGAEAVTANKQGVKSTKWETKEIGLKIAQINRNRTRERKEANVSTEKGTMGTIKENNLLPKQYDFNKISSAKAWEMFKKTVNHQTRANYGWEKYEQYHANYIQAVYNELGIYADDIVKIVRKIPVKTFYDLYYDDADMQIDFVYSPEDAYEVSQVILQALERNGFS